MTKKDCVNRAYRLLRVALLWTRKGGEFRRRFAMELSLVPKYLKGLRHNSASKNQIHWVEHELSFDKSPIFNVKIHRPASLRFFLPCISAEEADFDYDFGDEESDEGYYGYDCGEKSSMKGGNEEDEEEKYAVEEQGIDSRAEEFIAKFYEHLKLQRQKSEIQFTEMLNRGAR